MVSAKFRASTAHVDISQLRSKLYEIENEMLEHTKDTEGETCEYDLTKHVMNYLPTPVAGNTEPAEMTDAAKLASKMNLKANTKHLGVQSNDQSGSDMRFSMAVGMTSMTEEDVDMDPKFNSMFGPKDMRMLALVSHNNMKASMKQFVVANMNALKKFRLTGTNTTMSMLKEVFGNDPEVIYGPACKSGPLGGDAQLVAMAVTGQIGGCIFFIDPMDAHPHSADIECLVRQGNVHNILMMNNPSTAHVCMNSLRVAMKMGRMEMIPSFFFDLESPSVDAYKKRQKAVLQNAISRVSAIIPTREHQVQKAMVRANQVRVSFAATDDEVPEVKEDLYHDDSSDEESEEDFVPSKKTRRKKKKKKQQSSVFDLFACCSN